MFWQVDGFKGFGMVQIKDTLKFMELVGERTLKLSDCAVFMGLVAHADWKTGQIPVTAEQLAGVTKQTPNEVRNALSRLIKQNMLRRVRPTAGTGFFYAINPWMVEFGGKPAQHLIQAQFADA